MAGAAAIVRRSLATTAVVATSKPLNHQPLSQADPELYELLQKVCASGVGVLCVCLRSLLGLKRDSM